MKRLICKLKGAFTLFIYAILYDSYVARFVMGATLITKLDCNEQCVKMNANKSPRSSVSYFHNCFIPKKNQKERADKRQNK